MDDFSPIRLNIHGIVCDNGTIHCGGQYYFASIPSKSYDYVPLLAGWEHYQKFNFYVMTVLHIFVPFAILVILNISIVVLTKRKIHGVSWAMATLIDMPKVTEMIRKGNANVSTLLILKKTKFIIERIQES
ncbi:hypothetical protein COOONC_22308 [Cooperia oncophora]